jgi:hypothetical protein
MKQLLENWNKYLNEEKHQPMYIGYEPNMPGVLMAQVLDDSQWNNVVSKSMKIVSKMFQGQQKPEPHEKYHLIDRFVKLGDGSIHKVRTMTRDGKIELYGKELGRHPKISPDDVVAYSVQNVFLTSPSYEEAMENKKSLDDLEERCEKGYKTHPTTKTKKMYGKTYRNCVKAEE